MADIKLKVRDGTQVEHDGIRVFRVPKQDGTKEDYLVPTGNINITDTQITDVRGKATAQVVDANLVAENIAKGVTVLGISGTHEGGGGGSSIKIASGRITSPSDTVGGTAMTIEHNLGVVPDIVIFNIERYGSKGDTIMGVGFSKAFKALIPEMVGYGTPWIYWAFNNNGAWADRNKSDLGIDTATGSQYYEVIHSATNTTVTIGSNSYLPVGGTFYWVAIGGLT